MAPRKRLRKNKDLVTNLYGSVKNSVTYYQYKHPITGHYHSMGTNKQEFDNETYIQPLMAHADQKMTEQYQPRA
ncbi:phage integrase Arm DNA-binding domain-containing protein [Marinobacter sp. GN3S48]|uniref:phage integrase Arm DNA-binding domain-containing protein n=1 Tax=Marinobacter sp. GN3S48 TaxID=3382302 RepID=UPI00387B2AB4